MTQYAYPDDDPSYSPTTNWSPSAGSDRYAMVDDEHDVAVGTADNTYITVADDGMGDMEWNPNPEAVKLSLSNPFSSVTTPANRDASTHKVKILWYEDGGMDEVALNVSLLDTDGGAVKNETFYYNSDGGMNYDPQEDTMTLNAAQAASIGAYNDLSVIITATDPQIMGTNTSVYRVYFECPDPAAAESTPTSEAFLLFLD
jgi:hypothetical protein